MNIRKLMYIFILFMILTNPIFSNQENDVLKLLRFSSPLKNEFEKGYRHGLEVKSQGDAVINGYQSGFKEGEESVYNEFADYHCGIELENYSDLQNSVDSMNISADDLDQTYFKKVYIMGFEKGRWNSRLPEFKRAFMRGFEYGRKEAFQELYFHDSDFKLSPREQFDLGVHYASRSQGKKALSHFNYLIKNHRYSQYWSLAVLRAGTLNSTLGRHYDAGCCYYAYFLHFPDDKVRCEVLINLARELYLLSNISRKKYYNILLLYSKKIIKISRNRNYKAEAIFYTGISYEKNNNLKDSEASYLDIVNNYKTTSLYRKALKRLRNLRKLRK